MGTAGSTGRGKEVTVDKREGFVERVVRGIERRIEESHDRRRAREAELDQDREGLWAEAAERERLLVEAASEGKARDLSLEEAAREHRVVFVVHSEEVGGALEDFAHKGARLVNVVPASGGEGADIKGSWLVFDEGS